jgi:exodeoxyribonuclease V alpha subunit
VSTMSHKPVRSMVAKIIWACNYTDYLSGREIVDFAKRRNMAPPTKEAVDDALALDCVMIDISGVKHITDKSTMKNSSDAAKHIRRINGAAYELDLDAAPSSLGQAQVDAWVRIKRGGVQILCGGPGTGKTHMIATIVSAARKTGMSVCVLAPTGRAASILAEKCGIGSTVHSRIGFSNVSEGRSCYLAEDLIILDESSMVDSKMMTSVLGSVRSGASIMVVGDPDQLDPVGYGKPFSDMIVGLPDRVSRLTVNRRSTNTITAASSLVIEGKAPPFNGEDLVFMKHEPEDVASAAAEWYRTAVGTRLALASTNDLVAEVNQAIAGRKSPKPGDRIMFTNNNYDAGVENGSFGTLLEGGMCQKDNGQMINLDLYGENIGYVLGYCTTVHKAQGGQADNVFIAMNGRNMDRNLLYTAITRAKESVTICASSRAEVMAAIAVERPARRALLSVLLSVEETPCLY